MDIQTANSEPVRSKVSVCPHLGFRDDPETASAFPSYDNCCYRSKPILAIKLEYQGEYCLSQKYTTCPIFNKVENISPPKSLQRRRIQLGDPKYKLLLFSVIGVVILELVASIFLGVVKIPGINVPIIGESNTQTPTAIVPTLTATLPKIMTPTQESVVVVSTSTPTRMFHPTATRIMLVPTEPARHLIETPIGTPPALVIHRVLEGESYSLLATIYNTTVEAIWEVNLNPPATLWVDQVIIVPSNTDDVNRFPPFTPYEVTEGGITIEDVASSLRLDPELLKIYNALPNGYILEQGEWLLIPH